MLRTWLRSLFARKTTTSTKTLRQTRRPTSFKPTFEALEAREMLTATSGFDFFTMNSSNLHHSASAVAGNHMLVRLDNSGNLSEQNASGGWTNLDTSVQSFSIAGNGMVVDMRYDGRIAEQPTAGSPDHWTTIDTGAQGFAIAGNGMVVDLESNGYLQEQTTAGAPTTNGTNLDTGVQSFAIAGNGMVVDMRYNGRIAEQLTTANVPNSWTTVDTGAQAFAIAGNGMVVDLESNGYLQEQTVYGSPMNNGTNLDTGVASFAVAGNGMVVDMRYNGRIAEQPTAGSPDHWTLLDSGAQSFAIAGDGMVIKLTAGALYEQAAAGSSSFGPSPLRSGVLSFGIAGNGMVVDLDSNNQVSEQTLAGSPSNWTDLDDGATSIGIAGNGMVVDLRGGRIAVQTTAGSPYNWVNLGQGGLPIQSFAINGAGHIVELTTPATGGFLYEFMQPVIGGAVQIGQGIQSFAINGAGYVVELTTPATGGNLYEFMQPGNGGALSIGQGVQSFAINGAGHVVELASGNLYEFMVPGPGGAVSIGQSIQSFFINSTGDVVELTTSHNIYDFIQPGVGGAIQYGLGGLDTTQWINNEPNYSGKITVNGPLTNVAITGLPPGLSYTVSGNTINILGEPSQLGQFTPVVTASLVGMPSFTTSETCSLTIGVGPAYYFCLSTTSPSTIASGDFVTIHVTAYDQYGNVATSYNNSAVEVDYGNMNTTIPMSNGCGGLTNFPLYNTSGSVVETKFTAHDGQINRSTSVVFDITPAPQPPPPPPPPPPVRHPSGWFVSYSGSFDYHGINGSALVNENLALPYPVAAGDLYTAGQDAVLYENTYLLQKFESLYGTGFFGTLTITLEYYDANGSLAAYNQFSN